MNADFSVAVHALVYLDHKQTLVTSKQLAENICTNPARVRKIMSKLCKAGLVESKKGQDSGYKIVITAENIRLDQIVSILDERIVKSNWLSGNIDEECLVSSGMGEIMNGLYCKLNQVCMDKLHDFSIKDLENKIFNR